MRREIKSFFDNSSGQWLLRANHWGPKGHSSKTFAANDHGSANFWLDKKDKEK